MLLNRVVDKYIHIYVYIYIYTYIYMECVCVRACKAYPSSNFLSKRTKKRVNAIARTGRDETTYRGHIIISMESWRRRRTKSFNTTAEPVSS